MLLIFLIWIYTLCHALLWGQGVFHIFGKNFSDVQINISNLVITILTGLAAIATLAAMWSVFFPVGPVFQGILIAVSAISFFYHGKSYFLNLLHYLKQLPKKSHPLVICLGSLIFLLIWIKAACLSDNNDEGGYYLPLIKWIEQFPLVPGIANIEDRMGYNSNFHLLSAVFGFSFLDGKGFYDLGSVFFLLQQLLSLRYLQILLRSKAISFEKKWFYMTGAASTWYVNYITLSSPDTDLPANVLSWGQILLFLEHIFFNNKNQLPGFYLFLLIQAIFLTTMRFSCVWLILLPFWLIVREGFNPGVFKKTSLLIGIAAFIILPWCYRNYYISGYLVYPVYQVDFFDPDWKVPAAKARENYYYVRDYARRITTARSFDPNRTDNILQWLPITFQKKSLVGKFFILFVLGFSGIGLASFFLKWRWWRGQKDLLFITMFLIFNLLWWLYTFPDIRFAIAPLSITTVGALTFGILKIKRFTPVQISKTIAAMLILVWSLHTVMIFKSPTITSCGFIFPAPPFISDAKADILQGHPIFRTDHFSCGCAYPPCLNPRTSPELVFRGVRVSDGFSVRK